MDLSNLQRPEGSRKSRKRVGRGPGSGHGKTSCKGHKGQKARSGGSVRPGFEGGQMPLIRRLPKFGFTNIHRLDVAVLSTSELELFDANSVVDLAFLYEKGIVSKNVEHVKVLVKGPLTKKLDVKLFSYSKGAEEMISKAGGTFERVG